MAAALSELLPEALALADAAASVRDAAAALRDRLAPMRVVVVDAFDMRGETPVAYGERRLLWGASSDGHCWQVTTALDQAAGLFIADKD